MSGRRYPAALLVLLATFFCAPPPARAVLNDGMNAVDLLGEYTAQTSSATVNWTKSNMGNGPGQLGYSRPMGFALDATNHRLFVADGNNYRVLEYNLNADNTLPDKVPDHVLGQANFNANTQATTQTGMKNPYGLAFDAANNRLFVADVGNNRVLVFNTATITDGMAASNVLGQANFTSSAQAATQTGMKNPYGVAFDAANNRLFVADEGNNRVLVFNTATITDGMAASNVLGQALFTTNASATTQAGMKYPYFLQFDAANNLLFVSDNGNNRVLVYNTAAITDGMNAADLLGASSFTTSGVNNLGFDKPQGTALDATNHRLFVADFNNSRVLEYDLNADNTLPDKVPDHVLGQANFNANTQATTQTGMKNPYGLAFDAAGNRLFVADSDNNRVLVYNTAAITDGMAASNVLGQTLFTTSANATTQAGMYTPAALTFDTAGNRLFVADSNNNRVLVYNTAAITNGMNAANVLGENNYTSTASVTSLGFNGSIYGALDATNHRLFVADEVNNRVLEYDLNADNTLPDKVPDHVLGQANFNASAAATTQAGMTHPYGVAFDAAGNRLFVADNSNARVLVYNTASITNGMNAANVLGQTLFTTATLATTQGGMKTPQGLTFDAANNRLFVADGSNDRVLVYNTASITNGMNASNVLGQTLFTTSTAATTQAGMTYPTALALDATNNRLFVADSNNYRVLVFSTASITNGMNAANVLGEPNFTATNYTTTQAGMRRPYGLEVDAANNRLFVADSENNRVLIFNTAAITDGMNASNVLGQADFMSNNHATTQAGMYRPYGLAFDAGNNRLFVVDNSNDRVMIFNTSSITDGENAIDELGQYASATSSATVVWTKSGANNTPNEAVTSYPAGLAFDATNNRLFVGENNNRVLVFNTATITDGMNASNVLGQPDFTTRTSAVTQAGLYSAPGLAFDAAGNRLFVADTWNNRVLVFNTASITNGMNASNVLGQPDFTTRTSAVTQAGMYQPGGLAFDAGNNRLFVGDSSNSRVMIFGTSGITNGENASDLLGQYVSGTSPATVVWTKGGSNNTPNSSSFKQPGGLALDATNHRLFLGDAGDSRVLVFNLNTDGTFPTKDPANVLGQSDFASSVGAATQARLSYPYGVAFDAGNNRLFVADSNNSRVVIFDTSSIANGENATDEIGQYNSQTSSATVVWTKSYTDDGPGPLGYYNPYSITIDLVNHRMFVADTNNNRVLEYNLNIDNTLIDKVPDHVLGQPDYMSYGCATTQGGLCIPQGLAVDGANNRLFVADLSNNRVLVFNTAAIADGMNASNVLGQASFTSSVGAATQAGMYQPYNLLFDAANNRLFVSDNSNNRVLVYNTAAITDGMNASNVLGQPGFTTTTTLPMTQSSMDGPDGLAIDATNNRLFVADAWDCRVLVFDITTITNGMNASNVLGAPDFISCPYDYHVPNELTTPFGLAYDSTYNRLFVMDGDNERIVIYNTAIITNGMNASNVLGEPNLNTSGGGLSQSRFPYEWDPGGLFFDPGNSLLYFADMVGNRIMIFDVTDPQPQFMQLHPY